MILTIIVLNQIKLRLDVTMPLKATKTIIEMKKILLVTAAIIITATCTYAQSVGINTDGSNPDASAILDVKSNKKGILIPRMTKAERDSIINPATGLMVFQTNETIGLWNFYGGKWNFLSKDNLGDHQMKQNLATNGAYISKTGDSIGLRILDSGAIKIKTLSTNQNVNNTELTLDADAGFSVKGELGVGKNVPSTGYGAKSITHPIKVPLELVI